MVDVKKDESDMREFKLWVAPKLERIDSSEIGNKNVNRFVEGGYNFGGPS